MEDFGSRPVDGSNPLRFPDELKNALEKATVSFYVATSKKGELESFRKPMNAVIENKKIRHAHMPNITEQIMGEPKTSFKRITGTNSRMKGKTSIYESIGVKG